MKQITLLIILALVVFVLVPLVATFSVIWHAESKLEGKTEKNLSYEAVVFLESGNVGIVFADDDSLMGLGMGYCYTIPSGRMYMTVPGSDFMLAIDMDDETTEPKEQDAEDTAKSGNKE